MNALVGPYLYVAVMLIVVGLLAFRVMKRSGSSNDISDTNVSFTEADIEAAIRADRTIDAIKMYRKRTGCDLMQAKLAVDAIAERIARKN